MITSTLLRKRRKKPSGKMTHVFYDLGEIVRKQGDGVDLSGNSIA